MKGFLFGFTYPFKSLKLFGEHPILISYSIIPIIINIIIYTTIFFYSYTHIKNLTGYLTGNTYWWQDILNFLLLISAIVLLLIVCYLLFVIFGGIITAPFNEKISQITEESVRGIKTDYNPGFFSDLYISVTAELKKLQFYFLVLILIFFLNLIPLVGTVISFILGLLFSFFYNALDFLDYALTRKCANLKTKIKVTFTGGLISMGFGAAAFLIMFLPIVNVFLKPTLVVSGTDLFYNENFQKRIKDLIK